ncbi:transporter substrate-binding domain-containing protein [Gramella sp. AN32]|uniref:Transporter substrate-binding domain-containing protein n=1 Tax=Christiangramia antarctica TaxID=2058158 RepID=A0ABW5X9C9_9FLAO|nr:transporter substrate-binding domain-containing protein [Gramella sp. AN32]MCM4155520.1 hypothetical protein [Gramella sp. AN32]
MKHVLVIAFILVLAGCSFPKDPENSFEKAKNDELKIGIIENPPFITFINGKAEGPEIELIKGFARENNLKISFTKGNESGLIEELQKYKLHILSGGFEKGTIWKKEATPTAPYDNSHVFLVPKGKNRLLQHLETYILKNQVKE